MLELLESIESSLKTKNFYAALAVALSIPDVCAGLRSPNGKTTPPLYAKWFDDYLKSEYGSNAFVPEASLTGKDCYVLRCALLHNASDELPREGVKDVIQRIKLTAYGPHRVRMTGMRVSTSTGSTDVPDTLVISVTFLCQDICTAARAWLKDVANDPDIQKRIGETVKIHMASGLSPLDLTR